MIILFQNSWKILRTTFKYIKTCQNIKKHKTAYFKSGKISSLLKYYWRPLSVEDHSGRLVGDPHILVGDPHILVGDPQILIGDPKIFIGKHNMGGSIENMGSSIRILGSSMKIWGSDRKIWGTSSRI